MAGARAKNIAGRRFGKLTAIEATDERRSRSVVWTFRCDCGGEATRALAHIVHVQARGGTSSCGCVPPRPAPDLSGRRFGRLLIQGRAGSNGRGQALWTALCDCGGASSPTTAALVGGKSTSCGCLTRERVQKARQRSAKDLSGEVFGILTVCGPAGRNGAGQGLWRCECACGSEWVGTSGPLLAGHTSSCGCLKENGLYLKPRKATDRISPAEALRRLSEGIEIGDAAKVALLALGCIDGGGRIVAEGHRRLAASNTARSRRGPQKKSSANNEMTPPERLMSCEAA